MGLALQGPIFNGTTADRWLQEGDSISALDTYTQVPMLLKRRVFALAEQQGPRSPRPQWWNTCVSGTGLASSLTRLQAAIPKFQPTKIVCIYGTADIILGSAIGTVNDTTSATVLGAFKLIMDLTAGSGIPIYVATVAFVGEHFPTGTNAADTNIDLLVAGMLTIAARYPLCTIRDMRAALYTAGEPIDNVANIVPGPYARPDGANDAHHNPGGRGKADAIIVGDMSISTGTQSLGVASYSSAAALPNANAIGIRYNMQVNSSFNGGAGVADAGNVTAIANTGRFGSTHDLVTTSATKPVFRLSAAGKTFSAIESAGAAWIRSAVFTSHSQPFLTACVFRPTNLTLAQIYYDGAAAQQESSLAILNASGNIQLNAGVAANPSPAQPTAATTWGVSLIYCAGNRVGAFSIFNGAISNYMDIGGNFSRSQITLLANATALLPATGMVADFIEWHSSLGVLPRWQDALGGLQAFYGKFPQ